MTPFLLHTGNYVKAFSCFHRALSLVTLPEYRAIVCSQLSNLLRKLGYQNQAVAILDQAMRLTKDDDLLWKIRTQKALCYNQTDHKLAVQLLSEPLRHYDSQRNHVKVGRIKRHLGLIYVDLRDFQKAKKYFDEATEIAIEQGLMVQENEVMNDRGWMLIQQKQYEKARDVFDSLVKKELPPYKLSLALQNIGYLEYERRDYREAIKYHIQSLQLTTLYEMRDMAFEDYYKLGLCHEKLGEIALASHFFSTGYQELAKEVKMGLPILGYREKLLNAYVEFLKRNQRIPHLDLEEEIFGFAMDKSLKQIREVFRKSLLTLHLERTKNAPEMCKHLKIDNRTYFLYQKRLGLKRGKPRKGLLLDNPHFSQYIESLTSLPWREANKKFEQDLFAYLMAKYQHHKTRVAEALDVSYAQVVLKTR